MWPFARRTGLSPDSQDPQRQPVEKGRRSRGWLAAPFLVIVCLFKPRS